MEKDALLGVIGKPFAFWLVRDKLGHNLDSSLFR